VVVITAGIARKPGMSRDDLLNTNYKIVRECTENALQHSPQAILIVVSNPLDAMCQVARKVSGLPRERVFGMAGVLDSARMRSFIAMELGVSVENVHAFVLGGHGDTMVPLPRFSTVAGVPITELLPPERVKAICERTAAGGAEIVKLLKTGSAYYAPSASSAEMVEAVLCDKHKILPCCCYLEGEFGIRGLYVGVPAQLGRRGVERIWEFQLSDEERQALHKSAEAVKELVDVLKL
jgi:malate dehydrogenase